MAENNTTEYKFNTKSRTSNAGKNATFSVINKIIILFLTFISRKVFIQLIGVEYLGINGLFSNVLTLLSLADMGVGVAMNVSLYKPIAQNDTRKVAALLNYFRKVYYIIAAVVFAAGMALVPVLKYIVNLEKNIPHIYLYYILIVAKNSFSYLFVYKSAIIRADQRSHILSSVEIYVTIARILLQIVVLVIFKQYVLYLIVEILGTVAGNIVLSIIADKNYPFIKEKHILPKDERKYLFKDLYSMFIYKFSSSIITGTDNVLMSIMCGTVTVGLYSNYVVVTDQLLSFCVLLFGAITPSIGNLVVKEGPKKRYEAFKTIRIFCYWIAGMAAVGIFFLLEDFLVIWIGKDFLLDKLLLIAVVVNIYHVTCQRAVWTFREGTGMFRQVKYVNLVSACLNVGYSILFTKLLGVSGILFGTIAARFSWAFWFEPRLLFKGFFDVKPYKFYLAYLKNALITLLAIGVCYIPFIFIKEVNIGTWILKIVICIIVYNGLFFLFFHKSPEFKDIFERAKSFIGVGKSTLSDMKEINKNRIKKIKKKTMGKKRKNIK